MLCVRRKMETGLSFCRRRCYNRNTGQNNAHRLVPGGGIVFIAVKGKSLVFFGVLVCLLLAVGLRAAYPAARSVFSPAEKDGVVYVLDPGHGGEDGGAVSASGERESDVNLAVTLRLDALLRLCGRKTLLTRREDVSIYSPEAETLRQKKASDLKNRAALVNGTPGAVLVSIHQNSLPTVPSVHGAQVFFDRKGMGAALALSVQGALNRSVNAGNEKQEKMIDPSIYLMKSVDCPAILVECGFLSNRDEAARLQTPEHQKTLTAAIAAGILSAEERETAP